mgnify:FL=1
MELSQFFGTGNPFMTQYGMGQMDIQKQKQEADLATTLGLEQRNQAMHPAELAGKQAVTRLNNSTAAMNEDGLRRKIPAEDERKAALQASIAKMDDTSRAQMKAQVVRNMQLAAMMEKNGGQLPQGFNLSPEEMQIFTPKNLKNIIAHGQAFLEMDPDWLAERKKAEEARRLEGIKAQGRVELKTTPTAPKGGPSMAPPKMSLEQQMNYYNALALNEPDEAKKKLYQNEADRIELMIYRKAIAGREAGRVGSPDLSDPKFNIPTVPPVDLKPTPRDGGGLPSGVTKSGW